MVTEFPWSFRHLLVRDRLRTEKPDLISSEDLGPVPRRFWLFTI
jgi:hypothetical protein